MRRSTFSSIWCRLEHDVELGYGLDRNLFRLRVQPLIEQVLDAGLEVGVIAASLRILMHVLRSRIGTCVEWVGAAGAGPYLRVRRKRSDAPASVVVYQSPTPIPPLCARGLSGFTRMP